MIYKGASKIVFKTISVIVVGIFLCHQIAWAADLYSPVDKLNEEQSQQFAPGYVRDQRKIHQSLVEQKQWVEDAIAIQNSTINQDVQSTEEEELNLQGPKAAIIEEGASSQALATRTPENTPTQNGAVFSITTGEGDIIRYEDGRIISIKKADGTIIRGIVLSETGDLLNAEVKYPDGTIERIENAKIKKITTPNGTIFNYDEKERITSVVYPAEEPESSPLTVSYTYDVKDIDGALFKTALTYPDKTSFYDEDGYLERVRFDTGKLIEYDKGILSKVKTEDGKSYIYEKKENTQDGKTAYTVTLKEVIDAEKNIFRIENNNIVEIELSDGTLIRNFKLDNEGHIVNAKISYPDGKEALVENKILKELTDPSGIKTTYQYTLDADGKVTSCNVTIDNSGKITKYTYIKDPSTENLTIKEGNKTYEYDSSWDLLKYTDERGVIQYFYDKDSLYTGALFTLADGTRKEYDKDKHLVKTTLPDGTIYEYHKEGDFSGKLKKITPPDGKSAIYDYEVTPEGTLRVCKKVLYEDSDLSQDYFSSTYLDYRTNPKLQATFNLNKTKENTRLSLKAFYYNWRDKRVELTLFIRNKTPYIRYYSYNYRTRRRTYKRKSLNLTIEKGTDYRVEYLWADRGINVYLYKTSEKKPDTPLYTLKDNKWNPRFSIEGLNANIGPDPSSDFTYTNYENISTDRQNPLKGDFVHATEFKLNKKSYYNRFSYNIYGRGKSSYTSISLYSWKHTKPSLRIYSFDYKARKRTSKSVPIPITIKGDTSYIIEARREGTSLKLYVYEKGEKPGDPVYTMEGVNWTPKIYSSTTSGTIKVEAYDKPQIYEYKTEEGGLLTWKDTITNENITYIYDKDNELTSKEWASSGIKKTYNPSGNLLREQKPTGEVLFYEYDKDGNLLSINPQFPEGSILTYYKEGLLKGKLKKSVLPSGKTHIYDYKVTPQGNLAVYKRELYEHIKSYENSYSQRVRTDWRNPLKKSPLHITEFNFNKKSFYKSFYYSIYGSDRSSYTSISVGSSRWSGNYLRVYSFNYDTWKRIYKTIPIKATFKDNVTYVIETRIEDKTLKIYVYEKGNSSGEPVYTMEGVTWNPRINSTIYGGTMDAEAYDNLEIYELNKDTLTFENDIEKNMQNKNIIVDDAYKVIPAECLKSSAPLVFPDGKRDILNNELVVDDDKLLLLPGKMFDVEGNFIKDYDFKNTPYFDVTTYDEKRCITKVVTPKGEEILYKDGLIDSVSNSSDPTSYNYVLTKLGNIENIKVDRQGIKRIYDRYGNLQSLTLDNATKIVYENGKVSYIEKPDGTKIKNIAFSDKGELFGGLISYPDGTLAYYEDRELLNIITKTGDEIDYREGKIRRITLKDGSIYDWSYKEDLIRIHDHTKAEYRWYKEGRLEKLEELHSAKLTITYSYNAQNKLTASNIYKGEDLLYTYTYTYKDNLTLVHDENGNNQGYTPDKKLSYIIDSKGRKYEYKYLDTLGDYKNVVLTELTSIKDKSGKTTDYKEGQISRITLPDGTIIKDIIFDKDASPQSFTYIKQGSQEASHVSYYLGGFLKSVEDKSTIKEYKYGVQESKPLTLAGKSDNIESVTIDNQDLARLTSSPDPSIVAMLHLNGDDKNITFHGNAYLDTENKKFGKSSLALDGNGDFLSLPDSPNWDLSGDFTIDFWINFSSIRTMHIINNCPADASLPGWILSNYGTSLNFLATSGSGTWNIAKVSATWDAKPNTSYHIACVRKDSKISFYINGTKVGEGTSSGNITSSSPLRIGHLDLSNDDFAGHIDEVRIMQRALPISSFTPPEEEYHGIYNESGTLVSDVVVINATGFNQISWNEITPQGTNIKVQTRTGDTSTPDLTWSDWSESVSEPSVSEVTSPPAKYIQYKITLETEDTLNTPKLILSERSALTLNYIRDPESSKDADKISWIKVKENQVTTTYDEPQGIKDLLSGSTYLDELKDNIQTSRLNPLQKVITIYEKGKDTPLKTISQDGSTTYYEEGLVTKVEDKNGEILIQYTYDENKNLLKTEFIQARKKLDEAYQNALKDIATQKVDALLKLEQAEKDARENIKNQIAKITEQIASERKRLQQEKAKYDPNTYDLSEFDKVFRELDEYEADLPAQEAQAYADLDKKIAEAKQKIETDASSAMKDLLLNDYNVALGDICQKESAPVIYFYYRNVLGRDPDQKELEHWLNKAKEDLLRTAPVRIREYLQALPEYSERKANKENIIANIKSFFEQYFVATDVGKEIMLSNLGLTPDDVTLSVIPEKAGIQSILTWLDSQSLHFGDSAFKTIINLLESSGGFNPQDAAFQKIGQDAIKIDILTGVITKDTEGQLLISMHAMSKVAEKHGLTLYAEKVDFAELKAQYIAQSTQPTAQSSIILHITGDHYVLLKDIDETKGTVTYRDLSVGENGQDITLSRAEFMEEWQGYVLSKNKIINSLDSVIPAEAGIHPNKYLNVSQEKNIRGAGWWSDLWKGITNFFQKIVAPVATIMLFIPALQPIGAIALGINVMIQTVSFAVNTGSLMDVVWAVGTTALPGVIGAIGNVVGSVTSSLGSIADIIFAPLQGVFQAAVTLFEPIISVVQTIATGIGHIVTLGSQTAEIAMTIGSRIIAQAVGVGTSIAFQTMKIDPTLNYIGSALISGLTLGMGSPNFDMIQGALMSGTIAGVETLGKAADLDPDITQLAAMVAGTVVGNFVAPTGQQLSYGKLMESIAPNIISEAAYIGVTEVGEMLGIDPRISYLAGIGIRAAINPQIDPTTGHPRTVWDSVMTGLAQGIAKIGIEYTSQELDLDPLIANIGFVAISSLLQASIVPSSDPNDDRNVFEKIFDTFKGNVATFLGYNPTPSRNNPIFWETDPRNGQIIAGTFKQNAYNRAWGDYYWQESVYMSQIMDFADIVERDGLENALNIYATGFFNSTAINAIVSTGKTIGGYFTDALGVASPEITEKIVEIKDANDNIVAKAIFKKNDNGTWILAGKEEGDFSGVGRLGVDLYGELKYWDDAELLLYTENYDQYMEIKEGRQTFAEIRDKNGNTIFVVSPRGGGKYNVYNSLGEYVDAEILSSNETFPDFRLEGEQLVLYGESVDVVVLGENEGNYILVEDGAQIVTKIDTTNDSFEKEIRINDNLRNLDGIDALELIDQFGISGWFPFTGALSPEVGSQNTKKAIYFVMPGLANPEKEGVSPESTVRFKQEMLRQGMDPDTVFLVPLHEGNDPARDYKQWIRDALLREDVIAHEIHQKYVDFLRDMTPEQRDAVRVGVTYSGVFNPYLRALELYKMKTEVIVNYGGPSIRGIDYYPSVIDNPHLKAIINMYGSRDHYGDLVRKKNFTGIEVINIMLKDADHYDFSKKNNYTGHKAIINEKASQFNVYVTNRAHDRSLLKDDLIRLTGVTPIYNNGKIVKYEVDLEQLDIGESQ